MTDLTRRQANWISEDLKNQLLKALHPIRLSEDSTKYHIGYRAAQEQFKVILEQRLNAGPLTTIPE